VYLLDVDGEEKEVVTKFYYTKETIVLLHLYAFVIKLQFLGRDAEPCHYEAAYMHGLAGVPSYQKKLFSYFLHTILSALSTFYIGRYFLLTFCILFTYFLHIYYILYTVEKVIF